MDGPASPPEYDDAISRIQSPPPLYDCSVHASANVLLKWEFDGPGLRSSQRKWKMIRAKVRGTLLRLEGEGRGTAVSMQAADVGYAADYSRRLHCLRIRAEGRQFLLALASMELCLDWYYRIEEAIAISLPLETRQEPSFRMRLRTRSYTAGPTLRDEIILNWRHRTRGENTKWLTWHTKGTGTSQWLTWHNISTPLSCIDEGNLDVSGNDARRCSRCEHEFGEPLVDAKKLKLPKMMLPKPAALGYARRCIRELLYNSPWRYDWYYRDGERLSIPGEDNNILSE